MKEKIYYSNGTMQQLNNDSSLTKEAARAYSKGGEIFMAEPGKGENMPQPINQQPKNPEFREGKPSSQEGSVPSGKKEAPKPENKVSQEKVDRARKAAIKAYGNLEQLPHDTRQTVEMMIKAGIPLQAGGSGESEGIDDSTFTEAASSGSQPPEIKTGSATWKTRDADYPINITGFAGRGPDGKIYVNVEGTDTAIPLDEIQYPTEAGGAGQQPPGDHPQVAPVPPEEPESQQNASQREEALRAQAREILEDLVTGQVSITNNVGAGVTDETLINQLNTLKGILRADPPDKVSELTKAMERISLLERVSLGQEDATTKLERDRIFRAQRNSVVQRLGHLAENTRRATAIMRQAAEEIQAQETREGVFGERKLTEEEKDKIRNARTEEDIEDIFNRIFDKVDSRLQTEFNKAFGNTGAYEYDEFMRVLNDGINIQNRVGNLVRIRELEAIRDRLSNEREAREIIHNAFYAVIVGQNTEGVANFIAPFLAGYADLAFRKAGVESAMHFYEEALLVVREKNGGFLRPKDIIGHIKENNRGEVNVLTEQFLRAANEKGDLAVDREGRPRQLAKWELDRALSFSRGMSIIVGDSIEIAATSIIPGVELGGSAFNDLFGQRIIGEIFPFRHTAKFWTGSKFSKPLAYLLNRNRAPWGPKELEEFEKMDLTDQIKVLNDLMPEGQERFYSILNPLEIGGLFSRTGWRIDGDPRYAGETAIADMLSNPSERDWIGTGIIIERERGKLENLESKNVSKRKKAETALGRITTALERTSRITPLKLFLNIREVKERVLTDLFNSDYFTAEEKNGIQGIVDTQKTARGLSEVDERKKPNQKDIEILKSIKFGAIMDSEKFKKDFGSLVVLQEEALKAKDLQMVGDNSRLATVIRDTFLNGTRPEGGKTYVQAFLDRLQHNGWKVPFVFGTEDLPFSKYTIEDTGARSVARRWSDMQSAAKAGAAFIEFLKGIEHYTKPEQIVEAMAKIHEGIFGYNEEYAQKFTKQLAEGVMKFYGKSWTHRIPLGLGTLNTLVKGNSSYAQIAYGRDAMAWDELDLNKFTRLIRGRGLFKVEDQSEVQKRAGGGKKAATWDVVRTVLPLMMIAMAYYMLTETTKERRS